MSSTKTPDPPATIPAECAADYGKAECYRKGYEDGYGMGYERATKDCAAAEPGKRQKPTALPARKVRVECRGTDTVDCFKSGYAAGYEAGYLLGLIDAGEA